MVKNRENYLSKYETNKFKAQRREKNVAKRVEK
jgi:hypothetical protein